MIDKIQSLVAVGKFSNYQATGVVNFKKLTLIYAENGSGKTTLTRVLKSLTQSDSEIIRRRHTVNSTATQAAQIHSIPSLGAARITHSFGRTGWNNPLANIEIFDSHFVNENVYSGFDFTNDHKKKLHTFVMGAQGVTLHNQIEKNKTDKSNLRTSISGIEDQIIQAVGNGLTRDGLNAFIAIPATQPATLSQEITDARQALIAANANSVIQALPLLTPFSALISPVDFTLLAADLINTTHAIHDQVLNELYDEHVADLAKHGIQAPDTWLKTGQQYLISKDKEGVHSCPFCTQEIPEGLNIINGYAQKFNDVFSQYIGRLNGYLQALRSFNINANGQSILSRSTASNQTIASWSTHLTSPPPNTIIIQDLIGLTDIYNEVISQVERKIQNPLSAISANEVAILEQLFADINVAITTSNSEIQTYNTAITHYKNSIQTVAAATAVLNRCLHRQSRINPAIIALIGTLQTEKTNLATLETAYTGLMSQQRAASSMFFANYATRINHYLQTIFRTPFQIINVSHIAPAGQATQSRIGFALTINGQPISELHTDQTNIKDCLSEGDKSTIALAFFLSKLDIDPNRTDKIVVFDDPISSFDRNRRTQTIAQLRIILNDVKQLIVLSHNEVFLHGMSEHTPPADLATLQINYNVTNSTAQIQPLNLEDLIINDYFKNIKLLEDFLTNPSIVHKDIMLGLIRNVLESHLKFKFHRQLSHLSRPMFGGIITALNNSTTQFRDANKQSVITLLNVLND